MGLMNEDRVLDRLSDIADRDADRRANYTDLLAQEWAVKHSDHANLVQAVFEGDESLLRDLTLIYGVLAKHPTQGEAFKRDLAAAVAEINDRITQRVPDEVSNLMEF